VSLRGGARAEFEALAILLSLYSLQRLYFHQNSRFDVFDRDAYGPTPSRGASARCFPTVGAEIGIAAIRRQA